MCVPTAVCLGVSGPPPNTSEHVRTLSRELSPNAVLNLLGVMCSPSFALYFLSVVETACGFSLFQNQMQVSLVALILGLQPAVFGGEEKNGESNKNKNAHDFL